MTRSTAETTPGRRRCRGAAIATGLAAMLLAAAACGGDDADTTSAGAGGGDGGDGNGDELAIGIAAPGDGAEVGAPFELEVDAGVPLGEPDTGRHHVHVYYDGNTQEGEYDIVYGSTFTVDRLDPGQHTLEAVIANADHSLTGARDEITVTVTGEPGAGSDATESDTDATDSDTGGYGY